MPAAYNDVGVLSATAAGTGTLTLGSAINSTYLTEVEAGVPNAATVSYVIFQGTDIEGGRGTYTSSGRTLSRDTVHFSKIGSTAGTSKVSVDTTAEIRLIQLAADIIAISGNFTTTFTVSGTTSLTLPTSGTVATLSNHLGQFAATTSSQLAGVVSDETGTGSLVFATDPQLGPNIGVGTAATSSNGIRYVGTLPTTADSAALQLSPTWSAGTYTPTYGISISGAVGNGTGTIASVYGQRISTISVGTGGIAVTTMVGLWLQNQTAGATKNRALISDGTVEITAGTLPQLIIGHTASLASIFGQTADIQYTGTGNYSMSFHTYATASGLAPVLSFARAKTATVGGVTTVASGDTLLTLEVGGADGSTLGNEAGRIQCIVDAAVTTGVVPGRWDFMTTISGGGGTSATRFRIGNDGFCYYPTIGSSGTAGTVAHFNTGTSPANRLFIMTSSLRAKQNIADVSDERADAALDLRVIEYNSSLARDDQSIRVVGMGAEWVAEVDPHLVNWGYNEDDYDWIVTLKEGGPPTSEMVLKRGAEKSPDWVHYDQVNLLRTEALKRRCVALEARLKKLEGNGKRKSR